MADETDPGVTAEPTDETPLDTVATKKKTPKGMEKAKDYFVLDMRQIKGNKPQSRKDVIWGITEVGYGLFESLADHPENKPLWTLLTSKDAVERSVAQELIETKQVDLLELADGLLAAPQLQNIGVWPMEDGDGMDVIFGMRRCLAIAYNHCRSAGKTPLRVNARLFEPESAHSASLMALIENVGRLDESPVEQGLKYKKLMNAGMKLPELAEALGQNIMTIRSRLALLKLDQTDQAKISSGKMTQAAGLAKVRAKTNAGKAKPGQRGGKGDDCARIHVPTSKQLQTIYTAVDKPEDMEDPLWEAFKAPDARKLVALLLKVEYMSHSEMVRVKKAEETAKLRAAEEAAKKAADEAAAASGENK